MLNLKELRNNFDLLNSINWEILPEEAIGQHLEWGAGWAENNYILNRSQDITYHFVVSTWEEKPIVYLYKREAFDTEEIAKIPIPENLSDAFLRSVGKRKGTFAIEGEIKKWLWSELLEN